MAKKLSAKDLKQYHEGMFEIDYILGSTQIEFHPLVSATPSLYNEKKRAVYGDPIYFTGSLTTSVITPPFEDSNISTPDVEIKLPLLSFSRYVYVTDDELKEHPPIDPYSIVKGYFVIEGKKLEVQDCTPEGLFVDTYTAYKYKCRGVEKL